MDKSFLAAWGVIQKLTFRRYQKLLDAFGSLEVAWKISNVNQFRYAKLDEDFITYFFSNKKSIDPQKELTKLEKLDIDIVSIEDDKYPSLLKEIAQPPVFLYTKGQGLDDSQVALAVVGTRKNSVYGKQITENIVRDLVKNNITIVSGLALGIDGVAHQTTLDNNGKTVAVLACGLDVIYPPRHTSLAEKIIESGGAIISEFPLGVYPEPFRFPQRNRIVSGMTKGTLIIEAGKKSGALITARLALEQNREVFAVPGSIYSGVSIGTNALISKGEAKLVISAEDILSELDLLKGRNNNSINNQEKLSLCFADPLEQKIYEVIKKGSGFIDDVVRDVEIPVTALSSSLTMMEMRGVVKNMGGGYWVGT